MTGKTTQKVDRFGNPLMDPSDPFYSKGWIVGQTVSGATPNRAAEPSAAAAPGRETREQQLARLEPKREDFPDEESFLEALDGFKHQTAHYRRPQPSPDSPKK